MKKRIIVSAWSVLLAMMLTACGWISDPPIGETTETDLKDFGNYNSYVENALLSHFKGLLPSESTSGRSDQSYLYWYDCGFFGYPRFCIALTSQFEDEPTFDAERARIEALSVRSEEISDQERIYTVQGTTEDISKLLDDKIYDGTLYRFEIAIVNSESQSVEYFTALLCEGQMRTSFIDEFFKKIQSPRTTS